ncbi:MAG: anti-sigma F factor [Lachnospiraceae bacterium]|nr:anti-sigma F factor [Lachnospiraceae bacterium]
MDNANEMKLELNSIAQNESFARIVVAAFMSTTNPTLEEVLDVKTAVSEAVTNSIIHGYERGVGKIEIYARVVDRSLYLEITDYGRGIDNVEKAMEPLYTTKPEQDRSGMGFSFMEAMMNKIEVISKPEKGTKVKMWKEIGEESHLLD